MKNMTMFAGGLLALPAVAHPGHTEGRGEALLHALAGHGPALGAGLLAGVLALGLMLRLVRARRRQADRGGQFGM